MFTEPGGSPASRLTAPLEAPPLEAPLAPLAAVVPLDAPLVEPPDDPVVPTPLEDPVDAPALVAPETPLPVALVPPLPAPLGEVPLALVLPEFVAAPLDVEPEPGLIAPEGLPELVCVPEFPDVPQPTKSKPTTAIALTFISNLP
jgi:hypothetical protein